MKIDRAWKIGIGTSLISTIIFLYCLNPILKLVSLILFRFSGTLFHAYTDRLFAQAALGVGPDPALLLFTLTMVAIAGFFTAIVLIFAIKLSERLQLNRVSSVSVRSISRRKIALLIAVAVVNDFVSLLFLYNTYFQLRITSSFRQHVTAIAPYVSDHDMKVVLSRWTQMKGEADYIALYADLKAIADKNNIVLPENLVFTPTSL